MTIHHETQAVFCRWFRDAAKHLRPFLSVRRASVALESVAYLTFMVGMVGTVFEIVTTHNAGDILDRAAHAVARDHALQDEVPAGRAQLIDRAWDAIQAEVGAGLDRSLVTVDIKAYDNPSAMLRNVASTGKHGLVGGGPGDIVVVRLRYEPRTGFAWLRQQLQAGSVAFQALAMARNELAFSGR